MATGAIPEVTRATWVMAWVMAWATQAQASAPSVTAPSMATAWATWATDKPSGEVSQVHGTRDSSPTARQGQRSALAQVLGRSDGLVRGACPCPPEPLCLCTATCCFAAFPLFGKSLVEPSFALGFKGIFAAIGVNESLCDVAQEILSVFGMLLSFSHRKKVRTIFLTAFLFRLCCPTRHQLPHVHHLNTWSGFLTESQLRARFLSFARL